MLQLKYVLPLNIFLKNRLGNIDAPNIDIDIYITGFSSTVWIFEDVTRPCSSNSSMIVLTTLVFFGSKDLKKDEFQKHVHKKFLV